MKHNRLFRIIGVSAAFLVCVGGGLGVYYGLVGRTTAQPEIECTVSEQEAIEAVCQFEGHTLPDLGIRRMPDALQPSIELKDGDNIYWVDPGTGMVVGIVYSDALDGGEPVSLDEATLIGTEFAQTHYPDLSDLTLIESKSLDHGGYGEYQLVWSELVNAVPTPHKVLVSVCSDTGKLLSYIVRDIEIEPFADATVAADDAASIARAAYCGDDTARNPSIDEPRLEVVVIDEEQHLVWLVDIEEDWKGMVAGGMYLIDARSGEVVDIWRY